LILAIFLLPESRRPDSESAVHSVWSLKAWRTALTAPSVGLILVAMFVCLFSLANLENTLSLLIKGSKHAMQPLFDFTWGQVCLTYAFIGLTLSVIQGGLVRRLADRVSEGVMAAIGALLEITGFALMILAVKMVSIPMLFVALFAVVSGFAFIQPNLQSLLSRRADPKQQGLILGVGQSVSSLARIVGAYLGIPLLIRGPNVPYMTSAGLMTMGLVVIILAARSGKDFEHKRP
jgi:DHA1 family tetracycline resistance protein-like MFS transporter